MAEPADEQQLATEALYKQNLELAVRNKTLSLLRQLYQISILALEPKSLAEKIVTTVRETLELEFAGVRMFENSNSALAPLAFSFSERLAEAQTAGGFSLDAIKIENLKGSVFFGPLLKSRTPVHTDTLTDVWDSLIPADALAGLIASGHLKTVSAYPLIIDGTLSGILILGMNRPFESLSEFERESIANIVDVTAVAIDRARLYQALKVANAGQQQFIHYLNHESKGYLTDDNIVLSAVRDSEFGPTPPELAKMATMVLWKNKRAVDDIDDMIFSADLSTGAVRYTMEPFDLKREAATFVDEYKPDAEEKEQKLEFRTEPVDGDFTVVGDKRRLLRHAFKNYLKNAIVYTPNGGTITVTLSKKDNEMVLAVKDSGVGISDEDKARLFTEGGKGTHSTDVNPNSTGRGLYIVKQIAEAHHGRVWAESAGTGRGSTFAFEMPIKQ